MSRTGTRRVVVALGVLACVCMSVGTALASGGWVPPPDDVWLGWVLAIPVILVVGASFVNLLLGRREPPD